MKKTWTIPNLSSLSASNTNTGDGEKAPIVGGKCSVCNKIFATADLYEGHKVMDTYNGSDIGTECPEAPKGDGKLEASFIAIIS